MTQEAKTSDGESPLAKFTDLQYFYFLTVNRLSLDAQLTEAQPG